MKCREGARDGSLAYWCFYEAASQSLSPLRGSGREERCGT